MAKSNFIDLTGKTFHYWTVQSRVKHRHKSLWLVKCKCGHQKILNGQTLRTGNSKSCGCWARERLRERYRACWQAFAF